ncbi:hypothetical protein [Virgibacillus sp. MG-45]|uniref:hypothetical protein n=1 Tax=Virgibacillus sp. MG-45 TaxID=3102791 RepID=UPI002ED80C8B
MSTSIKFHRELDEKLMARIGYSQQPLKAYYTNEMNETIEMGVEPEEGLENTFQLADPKVHYDPDIHDLNLVFEFGIENTRFLFGENGLTGNDGVLGIAVRWHSRDSAQQKVVPATVINSVDDHIDYQMNLRIQKGTVRGKVSFEVILYVVKPAHGQIHLVSGTVLGVLRSSLLLFDGNTSMFPILEVNNPNKGLWWVDCNFTDPSIEPFDDEHVAIVINKGHRHYKQLKIEKGIGSSPLMLEIVATGLQIIIETVKSSGSWQDILANNSETGSIGEAIYYFINTFPWDTSSPENLLRTMREDFNSRF